VAADDRAQRHYAVEPDPDHEGRFRVVDLTQKGPDGGPDIKGRDMTKANAVRQFRLLEAVKHDPGWTPQPGAVSTLKNVPRELPGHAEAARIRKARRTH
jgi:hypothetical protein